MATIRWRGKDEDHAQLCWSENGVEHRESLGRIAPSEAETRRKAKEVELDTGEPIFVGSVRFVDHREEYLRWHALEFPDSHFRVEQILNQCCEVFEPKALAQIKRLDVDQWKAARMSRIGVNRQKEEAQVSRGTSGKEFRTVKALFTKAVQWERIRKNPFEGVPEPKELNSAPPHWYRKHELARLYGREQYGDTWKLMANAGLRREEALKLRPEHVDIPGRMLHVLSSEAARTKSGKWRQVPLSDAALDALSRLLAAHEASERVIPHVTGPSLSRAFLRDAKALKLKGSLHSLRHSYGAHMVMAGVSIRALKDLMGHARIETTMIYAHIAEDVAHVQARAVNL
jgi:integrase